MDRAVELGIGPGNTMRNLIKKYSKKFPESPKSIEDIIAYFAHPSVSSTTGQTKRKPGEKTTEFFKHAYQCDEYAFCIFASDDVIEIIETISVERRMYFADGTFKICPYGEFKQVLLLSVDICGQVSVAYY